MCGLYSFRRSPEEARGLFRYKAEAQFPPRPYVAPGQPIGIVRIEHGEPSFALVRWGLIPGWTKELKPGKPLINARAETVLEKASFRNAMRRRRCLVPADGFYEWRGEPGRKQAFHIHRPDHALFAFAGLWESWMSADGSEIDSACIVTTAANATVAAVHDRMPVVIPPERYADWLCSDEVSAEDAAKLLVPAAEDFFVIEPTVIERTPRPVRPAPAPAPATASAPSPASPPKSVGEQLKLF
ncbi:MAG: SOS response-associated peptidase [Hyphomicrobiales bacterium]